MLNEIKSYVKICQNSQVKPNEEVISALKSATSTGHLVLSRKVLSSWTWEILGQILSKSKSIQKVDFSDCLIPYKGLVSLLSYIGYSPVIHTLILRGNNIQSTSVSYIGSVLKNNATLKVLSLEWNSLGLVPETFCMFCDALSVNVGLESLDLKNNQLPPQVARDLAQVIIRNRTLKTLDLKWNNIGYKGGQIIYAAMQKNSTITKIKLQGNYIQDEVLRAIENCAKHNSAQESIVASYSKRAEVLKDHMKGIEANHVDKYERLVKESEQRIQDIVRLEEEKNKKLEEKVKESEELAENLLKQNESRVAQLESALRERNEFFGNVQSKLELTETELEKTKEYVEVLKKQLQDKDMEIRDLVEKNQNNLEDLQQKLLKKDEDVQSSLSDLEKKYLLERRQNSLLQVRLNSRDEEVEELNKMISELNEKIKSIRKQNEENVAKKESIVGDLLAKAEQEYSIKLNRVQNEMSNLEKSLTEKLHLLKQQCESLEKSKSELQLQLSLERAQQEETVAVAVQKAKAKEATSAVHFEEKCASLREEKSMLEKQLTLSNTTISQLQQQNSTLIAELAEPQRKLNKLHEELALERITVQKVKQELSEAYLREQEKRKEVEKLEAQIESFHRHLRESAKTQEEKVKEHEVEMMKLRNSLLEKEKEISSIRAEEVERAGVLYSAFSRYLTSLGPSAQFPKPPLLS